MKNVKVINKAAIFLMVFVLAFSSLSAAAAVTYSRGGKRVRYTGSSYKVYYNSKRVNSVTRPGLMVNGNIMIPYSYTMVKRGPKLTKVIAPWLSDLLGSINLLTSISST